VTPSPSLLSLSSCLPVGLEYLHLLALVAHVYVTPASHARMCRHLEKSNWHKVTRFLLPTARDYVLRILNWDILLFSTVTYHQITHDGERCPQSKVLKLPINIRYLSFKISSCSCKKKHAMRSTDQQYSFGRALCGRNLPFSLRQSIGALSHDCNFAKCDAGPTRVHMYQAV
jgi:hypothetical protein